MNFFNPSVRDFLEKNKDLTLLGLSWAVYWRMAVVVIIAEIILIVTFFVFVFLGAFFGSIISG